MDELERVVRPIVEGQVLSFLIDHPEVAEAWRGKLPKGKTKRQAVVDSVAKRVVRDLICADTRRRLIVGLAGDGGSGVAVPTASRPVGGAI